MIYTSLSEKGQVVIPKAIRDGLSLNVSDRLEVSVKDGEIIMKRIPQIDEVFGMVKTNRIVSKAEMKASIRKQVLEKFKANA